MEKDGGFFLTGRNTMEVGKWSSAATLSSSSFSDNQAGRRAHQLEYGLPQFHPQQQHHLLTCLKLGKKRQNEYAGDQQMGMKREKPESVVGVGGGVIPRCQVDGCNKPLLDAKDYHRRHKVCEMHSKAPRVVILGGEQRFCQQCSRFHAITEFDDTKRSCRRRLAGHNERRRKSTNAIMRNASLESSIMGSRFAYLSQTLPGRALSLLSSDTTPWIPTPELSSRSSAALRELMAENRAALLARQLFTDRGWHNVGIGNLSGLTYGPNQNQGPHVAPAQLVDGWNKIQDSDSHVTLDLMQTPNSTSFEFLSGNKLKEDEEQCCEIWKSLECTHVV